MTQEIKVMYELVKRLMEADTAYYKHDAPIMTDREYDRLYDELLAAERSTGIVLSGSPTQKVSGEILESLEQVGHTKPMLSAKKTKSKEEIAAFVGGRPAVVMWKLDGLTLVLRYDGGKLVQAITRGAEGRVGEDVTHSVRVMTNVPLQIPYTEPFEVRGEGVISWSRFNEINDNLQPGEEPYSHPRSLAAGSVRRLDVAKAKEQGIEFFAFELVSDEACVGKTEQIFKMWDYGFTTVPFEFIGPGSDRAVDLLDSFDPTSFDYPVDGLIIEYEEIAHGKSLGATGHHENRLIALKWEDDLHETTFLGLEAATTRTGMVSLTGIFEDVVIGGATINRAYLHNLDIIDSFELGIGDKVQLYKANMIIPQMAENLTRSGTLEYPAECPCCGSSLVIRASTNGTRFLYCEEPTCPAKLVRKFVHFCDKTRMDIPGLSEKTLQKLISNGWVKNFGDLYELERHREAFINTPGFGEKLFEKVQTAIDGSRQRKLNQFIAGMGIHTVGRTAGRALDAYFNGDWDAFENAIQTGFDFTTLKDFGQTMHENIYAWYADVEAEKLWRPLLKHITFIKTEKENNLMNTNNPFYGKTVVATGTLQKYTRESIQLELFSLGAKPSNSVSKKTDYLIVGEGAGGKLDKAKSLGVKTLTEAEFEDMCAETQLENTMDTLTIKRGRLFIMDYGYISDLAVLIRADNGAVLSCGDYEIMVLLRQHSSSINGWDMRVIHIAHTDPDAAIKIVSEISTDSQKCLEFLRLHEDD